MAVILETWKPGYPEASTHHLNSQHFLNPHPSPTPSLFIHKRPIMSGCNTINRPPVPPLHHQHQHPPHLLDLQHNLDLPPPRPQSASIWRPIANRLVLQTRSSLSSAATSTAARTTELGVAALRNVQGVDNGWFRWRIIKWVCWTCGRRDSPCFRDPNRMSRVKCGRCVYAKDDACLEVLWECPPVTLLHERQRFAHVRKLGRGVVWTEGPPNPFSRRWSDG